MKNNQSGFIIFSSQKASADGYKNKLNHASCINLLISQGIQFKTVQGVYKGVTETSIVVSDKYEHQVNQLCEFFEQESFLRVDGHKQAWLHYTDGRLSSTEFIGRWKSVCPWLAGRYDSSTFDPATKQHYTVVNY